jgi:hypothetical protein
MANQRPALQLCPTRIDRQPVLFAHKVTRAQCQDRQRGRYHKCFTCAFNNAYVAKHGEPSPEEAPAQVRPAVIHAPQRAVAMRAG